MYRIRRDYETHIKTVFVLVESFDIIPYIDTVPNHRVQEILSDLREWYETWTTLSVYREDGEVKARKDAFKPLRLKEGRILLGTYSLLFDYVGLPVEQAYSYRVESVILDGRRCFLKLAHSEDELVLLANEIRVYHTLMLKGSRLAPRLLGYACDGSPDRVVGFFYEEVVGEYPTYFGLKQCENALEELHDLHMLHGDITRFNMLVAANGDGVNFIDFAKARIGPEAVELEWEERKIDEELALTDLMVGGIYFEDEEIWEQPLVVRNRNLGTGPFLSSYLGMSNPCWL